VVSIRAVFWYIKKCCGLLIHCKINWAAFLGVYAQRYSVGTINVIQLICAALLGGSAQHYSVGTINVIQLFCAALLGWYDQRHSVVLRSITWLV
jgi:hypothetical protein